MDYVTAEELEGKASNKYEAVVVAALRARQLNILEKKKPELEGEVEDEEMEKEKKVKVTVIALNELVQDKLHFQKLEK